MFRRKRKQQPNEEDGEGGSVEVTAFGERSGEIAVRTDMLARQREILAAMTDTRAFDDPAYPNITHSTSDMPILGYKRTQLQWAPGGEFSLRSNVQSSRLLLDADAECRQDRRYVAGVDQHGLSQHQVPALDCTCGFYALRTPDDGEPAHGTVRVDVELSGRVIVHEAGYRAQHQRVLRVYAPGCFWCGDPVSVVQMLEYIDPSREVNMPNRIVGATQTFPRFYCTAHCPEGGINIPMEKVLRSIKLPWSDSA